jgi:hypothetical protein
VASNYRESKASRARVPVEQTQPEGREATAAI